MSVYKIVLFVMLSFNVLLSIAIATDVSRFNTVMVDMHEHLSEVKYLSTSTTGSPDCGEYQIVLELDGVLIYDGERKVAFVPNAELDKGSALDKVFIKDNE